MIPLTDNQYEDFQKLVPWFSGTKLPDGRILGNAKLYETSNTQPILDAALRYLPGIEKMTGIELGCGEGAHTVNLAPLLKHLTCVEVRPANIVPLLTRLFVYDFKNVDVWMKDVSIAEPSWGKFDVMFHMGLLYHFINPVAHLHSLKGIAPRILMRTHYGRDSLTFPRTEIVHEGKRYPAYVYREHGWKDPWSGVEPVSHWLSTEVLVGLLQEIGYQKVEVVADTTYSNLPLITLYGEA